MEFVEPKFEVIEQNPGLDGVLEIITKAGFTCYKTEREITKESSEKFVQRMINSKHGAMLEHGTVYLAFPWNTTDHLAEVKAIKYKNNHFSKVNFVSDEQNHIMGYVTTNYRVLVENNWLEDLKYQCEPTPYHERRVSLRLWMDRVGTQSCERHRGQNGASFAQESTRYCNYANEKKFNTGIKISVPHWTNKTELDNAMEAEEDFGFTNLKLIHESYFRYLLDNKIVKKQGEDYKPLMYWLAANSFCDFCYCKLIDCGFPAEDARAVLPLDINSEFVMTMFVSDWIHFINLRSDIAETGRPHPDIQKFGDGIKAEFLKRGYIKESDLFKKQ